MGGWVGGGGSWRRALIPGDPGCQRRRLARPLARRSAVAPASLRDPCAPARPPPPRAAVAANRVAQGVSLSFARAARPLAVGLWAALLAALLRPIHQLADALVFSKVRPLDVCLTLFGFVWRSFDFAQSFFKVCFTLAYWTCLVSPCHSGSAVPPVWR